MQKRILIIGSFDTKSPELFFLREKIRGFGCEPVCMDTSLGRGNGVAVEIAAGAVAEAAGVDIEDIRSTKDTHWASEAMIRGGSLIASKMCREGALDGIVSVGGASNTGLSTRIMGALPFGIAKVMVSSMAAVPAYAGSYFGTHDIAMIHSVVDIAGLNPLMENVLTRAAAAVTAMALSAGSLVLEGKGGARPRVAITEFKFSEVCSKRAAEVLTKAGCDVVCFHAQGLGDRAMEELIEQGVIDAVLDLVPAGVAEELLGGNRSAGPGRLTAAAGVGIPQVLTPCGFDMLSCGPLERREKGDALWVSRKLSQRRLFLPDALRVQARTSQEELSEIADVVAGKLFGAAGPWTFLIPTGGWSSLSEPGGPLFDPEADRVFTERFTAVCGGTGSVRRLDMALNTREFGEEAATALLELMDLNRTGKGAGLQGRNESNKAGLPVGH